jgi:2-keto-3-deoxy-L-arabinonate dehydratase
MTVPQGGIYPMLHAFFTASDALDREAMRRQVLAVVKGGAHGLAMLGLGTEVAKLSRAERRTIVEWAAEDLGGALPFAVTVAEGDRSDAVAAARAAQDAGAAFVILQPPPVQGASEADQIRFFGGIADRLDIPVAIQNAPQYLGVGLTVDGITSLHLQHPNVSVMKAEGSALFVNELHERTGGRLTIFNGRCGLELTDNLRAGCRGMIPGIESLDVQSRIFDLMTSRDPADEAEADRLYAEILPMLVFIIQSLDAFICYGKRIAARRLGVGPVHDRQPALMPDPNGLAWAERLSAQLRPFEI